MGLDHRPLKLKLGDLQHILARLSKHVVPLRVSAPVLRTVHSLPSCADAWQSLVTPVNT